MTAHRALSLVLMAAALTIGSGCSEKESKMTVGSGAAIQSAVNPQPPKAAPAYFRDHYAKLEDCVYDWGYAQKCTPVPPGSAAQQAGANFLGPIYARSYRDETQVQLRKEAIDGGYAQRVAQEASDKSIAKSEVKS
jgi:hypothetical protein